MPLLALGPGPRAGGAVGGPSERAGPCCASEPPALPPRSLGLCSWHWGRLPSPAAARPLPSLSSSPVCSSPRSSGQRRVSVAAAAAEGVSGAWWFLSHSQAAGSCWAGLGWALDIGPVCAQSRPGPRARFPLHLGGLILRPHELMSGLFLPAALAVWSLLADQVPQKPQDRSQMKRRPLQPVSFSLCSEPLCPCSCVSGACGSWVSALQLLAHPELLEAPSAAGAGAVSGSLSLAAAALQSLLLQHGPRVARASSARPLLPQGSPGTGVPAGLSSWGHRVLV